MNVLEQCQTKIMQVLRILKKIFKQECYKKYSFIRILKRILRKRLPASKTERRARQASPKTDQWMCTKLEKEEKIKGSDRCEKEEKGIKGVIKMNKKKKETSEAKTVELQQELLLLQLPHSDGKDTSRKFDILS